MLAEHSSKKVSLSTEHVERMDFSLKVSSLEEGERLGTKEVAMKGGLLGVRLGEANGDLLGVKLGDFIFERKSFCSAFNQSELLVFAKRKQ